MPDYFAIHLLLDQLVAEGITFLFGTPRTQQSPIVSAAQHSYGEIRYIEALHENIACGLGLGYAQASGKPGVISLPTAPGSLASLPAIYSAKLMRVPLIIISEQPDAETLNDEPPLSADLVRVTGPLCKWSCQLNSVAEIPRLIRRAFHEAQSAPKGPVFISLPMNLLLTPASPKTVLVPHASPLGCADSMFLRKVSEKIVEARLPCIIAGNEVSLYRARSEVVALAEVIGCPVFIEPLPTGVNFPNRHALFASVLTHESARAGALLKHFDVLITLGVHTRPTSRAFELPFIPPTSSVLQINIEPGLHGRGLPNELSATADIKESLSRLRTEIQLTASSEWLAAAKERADRTGVAIGGSKAAYEDLLKYPNHAGKITLPWLLRSLEATRPNKSVIVNDLNASEPHVMESLAFEHSFAYFACNSGAVGYGPAAALGILLASPTATVICLTDDQSLLAYPQVLWTANLLDSNVKIVVLNMFGSKSFNLRLSRQSGSQHSGLSQQPLEFRSLAASMSIPHQQAADMQTLEKTLKILFETEGPQLLEVILDPS